MYKSERGDSQSPLWEERIVLVFAIDENEAKQKATALATEYESEYTVLGGAKVKWKFHQIERVFSIDDDLKDGAELFSRFLRNDEAKSILTPFDDE